MAAWPLSSSNLIQPETHLGVERLLYFLSFSILLKPQDNKTEGKKRRKVLERKEKEGEREGEKEGTVPFSILYGLRIVFMLKILTHN